MHVWNSFFRFWFWIQDFNADFYTGLAVRFWIQVRDSGLGFLLRNQVWDTGLGFWFGIQVLDSGLGLKLGIPVCNSSYEIQVED